MKEKSFQFDEKKGLTDLFRHIITKTKNKDMDGC